MTIVRWCEDCKEDVEVYGHIETGTPWFIEEIRDGHEDHDLSDPAWYDHGARA